MRFHQVHWLTAILALVPLCVLLLRWGARQRRERLNRVIAPRLHDQLVRSVDYARRRWKQALFVAGLMLLLAALARPQWGFRQVKVERPGVDVMLALDVSRSMQAEDAFATNRLGASKAAAQRLLDLPSNDRFGLVAFAGEAFLVSPITQDHGAIARTIGALTTTSVSKPGTDLAAAIKLAARTFEEKQEAGKAIILMTDGEELQGDAVVAAREAAAKGIRVFTVGVGTAAGARVPDRQWGQLRFAKNEFGRDVVSRLNERVLQQVAASGRGFYQHLGPEGEGLQDVNQRGLRLLAKGSHLRQSKDRQEFFQWPLAFSLALLLVEMLVNERKRV